MSDATRNYHSNNRAQNVTVIPKELQRQIDKQKKDYAAVVASHVEYRRVRKGKRIVTHEIPNDTLRESDLSNDKITIATIRQEH